MADDYDGEGIVGTYPFLGFYRWTKRGSIPVVSPMYDEEHRVPYLHWYRGEWERFRKNVEDHMALEEENVRLREELSDRHYGECWIFKDKELILLEDSCDICNWIQGQKAVRLECGN